MNLIAQGAEAKLFRDKNILIKERVKKSYRIPELDKKLRSSRTRREAKILEKLAAIQFPSPKLLQSNDRDTIRIEFIEGKKLSDVLEKIDYKKYAREIGRKVALLHAHDIMHGDLTTSNIILGKEVYFIDFGLSFLSSRIEDRAVDLHLFRQALESKHHSIWEVCFKEFCREYKKHSDGADVILERLEQVEKRGRHKNKY